MPQDTQINSLKATRGLLLLSVLISYRKTPKINPEAYIFQRSLLRGLFLEGLIFGEKFALLTWLAYSWKELYVTVLVLLCFILHLRAFYKYKSLGVCIWRGDSTEVFFFCYESEELIFGGAYTRVGLFSEF